MKSIDLIVGIVAVLSLIAVPAQGQGLQTVLTACSKCHGMDGNSVSPEYPKLAGQQKEYLLAQMKAFRHQSRKSPGGGLLLEDEIAVKVADYYFAQKPARGTPGDAQLSAKGKVVYENGISSRKIPACAFCHARDAQGMGVFPRLAGQHPQYLRAQIKVFHTDGRPNLAFSMKSAVDGLNDEEAEQVVAYLQGL